MKLVRIQIVTAYFRGVYDPIMLFIDFYNSLLLNCKFKHCNDITGNELAGNRATDQLRIFLCT